MFINIAIMESGFNITVVEQENHWTLAIGYFQESHHRNPITGTNKRDRIQG